jgi:hypothetical protein
VSDKEKSMRDVAQNSSKVEAPRAGFGHQKMNSKDYKFSAIHGAG